MNGLSITSSVIVARAMGYQPEGAVATTQGVCSFCGLSIKPGALYSNFSASPAFMDDLSLAARGSGMTCGHCAPLMTATALREVGYGVFTENGTRPFRKWGEIAAALTTPPNEPFVMVYSTAKNQHIAWRAPVNFSPELFYVRVGLRDLKIRHAALMQAVEDSQFIGTAFGYEATAKTLAHPFLRLSSDLKEIGHGSLRIHSRVKADQVEAHKEKLAKYATEIDRLTNLTLGETWALRFLLTPGAGSA